MTVENLQKVGQNLTGILPIYLAVQGAILLMTFLDFPVYMEAYQVNSIFKINGWLGAWIALTTFGLIIALYLLLRKRWKLLFNENMWMKLVMGYILGTISGMLTLGLRFMPVLPPQYFLVISAILLIWGGVYLLWKKRLLTARDMFP